MNKDQQIKLLRTALQDMLTVSLQIDDRQWANAVHTVKLRCESGKGPCDNAMDALCASSPHSPEWHAYNRDLALRARNGQVGSGMTFRP